MYLYIFIYIYTRVVGSVTIYNRSQHLPSMPNLWELGLSTKHSLLLRRAVFRAWAGRARVQGRLRRVFGAWAGRFLIRGARGLRRRGSRCMCGGASWRRWPTAASCASSGLLGSTGSQSEAPRVIHIYICICTYVCYGECYCYRSCCYGCGSSYC